MNTIADLAWAAGIIDGEGSIFIMKQQRKDRERGHNYILRISVQSTDLVNYFQMEQSFHKIDINLKIGVIL